MLYQHIFFDLDHTLWDLEANTRESFTELFEKYNLPARGIDSVDGFLKEYFIINNKIWSDYGKGLIDKDTMRYKRFYDAFALFDINDKTFAESFANDYSRITPYKTNLFPHAKEVLDYLQDKYTLHIITNGFAEVQFIKMNESGITDYFTHIITSEAAGFKKPDVRIFEYALKTANADIEKSLMIGDNLDADIIGAREAGIHQLYFNPKGDVHSEEITFEIKSLGELLELL
jgi:putative hydrolase of the HAD superfamily